MSNSRAMTGPEHYQHAEQLLGWASDEELGTTRETYCLAAAQVHAMLALAAATAVGCNRPGGPPVRDWDAWRAACATPATEVISDGNE